MAYKPSPNSLIHCAVCGEDYSATYKRCPFCGAKNAPPAAPPRSRPSRNPEYEQPDPQPAPSQPAAPADPDDTYVFDGQDLFDDEREDDYAPVRPKGGKRLAGKPSPNPFANADVNWPRMITFICSLVIIVAAMVIVFTVVYPQLRGDKDPVMDNSESPSFSATAPVGNNTQPVDPNASDPAGAATDPVTEPSFDVPPADPNGLTTISFKGATDNDFTLQPNESHTITLKFDPAGWSGTVTWTSTDTRYATVDANGTVTNVNTTDRLHSVTITAAAEGLTLESTVYCRGVPAATEPPETQPPASEPPAAVTQPPSSSGGVAVGRQGTIVNASGGLNVRSGPGTSYERIASLVNGNTVNVLEDAGGGWYKISFPGTNGIVEGYIMGDYISTN